MLLLNDNFVLTNHILYICKAEREAENIHKLQSKFWGQIIIKKKIIKKN